jgi:hypothetical protein
MAGQLGRDGRDVPVRHDRPGPRARPVQENINFYEQVNELRKIAHLLHGGYSTHLDEYEQMRKDVSWY